MWCINAVRFDEGKGRMMRIGLVVVEMLCAFAAFGDLAEYVDPFVGTVYLLHLFEGYFLVGVLDGLDNRPVPPYLEVTFVNVDDYVEIVCISVHSGKLGAENVIQYAHHRGPVNVLQFFEFSKCAD